MIIWDATNEGENFAPDYPSQGQLFHNFIAASARGHSTSGPPRELIVYCQCGWAFKQTKGIRRTTYKKQMQELYRGHIRAALDCNTLFATWAIGPIV